MKTPIRILGCGHWSMTDDQAGLVTATLLAERHLPDTDVSWEECPGTALAPEELEGVELLVVIDATPADERHRCGAIDRIDYRDRQQLLRLRRAMDTHSIDLVSGLKMAEALQVLPRDVWIYVIFGKEFHRSLSVSSDVAEGIKQLADRIAQDVVQWRERRRA